MIALGVGMLRRTAARGRAALVLIAAAGCANAPATPDELLTPPCRRDWCFVAAGSMKSAPPSLTKTGPYYAGFRGEGIASVRTFKPSRPTKLLVDTPSTPPEVYFEGVGWRQIVTTPAAEANERLLERNLGWAREPFRPLREEP